MFKGRVKFDYGLRGIRLPKAFTRRRRMSLVNIVPVQNMEAMCLDCSIVSGRHFPRLKLDRHNYRCADRGNGRGKKRMVGFKSIGALLYTLLSFRFPSFQLKVTTGVCTSALNSTLKRQLHVDLAPACHYIR